MQHTGWHFRNYLPHFGSADVIRFVMFRLADSLPVEALTRLEAADKPEAMRHEMLDREWGACWLEVDTTARLVADASLKFDGDRCRLRAWPIMPDHGHALFTAWPGDARSSNPTLV